MRTACLINHYNYGRFVEEALGSVLRQTVPFDEIVLVDDGSDAESRRAVERLDGRDPRLRVLRKENGGQLSCLNEGFAACSADVIAFLDADDLYEPGYLEAITGIYRARPEVDFVACQHRRIGPDGAGAAREIPDRDLGYSVICARYRRGWVGAPTSCLSMRRRILERILPLPFPEDWRTRADDCLVFGSSLAEARKYFLGRPLVHYRIHGANLFQGRPFDRHREYARRVAVSRLISHMTARMGHGDDLDDLVHREFRTIDRPTRREYRDYRALALRARRPWSRRLAMWASIAAWHYLGSSRG